MGKHLHLRFKLSHVLAFVTLFSLVLAIVATKMRSGRPWFQERRASISKFRQPIRQPIQIRQPHPIRPLGKTPTDEWRGFMNEIGAERPKPSAPWK